MRCRYCYLEKQEQNVSIDVSHNLRDAGAWQHQGSTCAECRKLLRGYYRRCKCGETG